MRPADTDRKPSLTVRGGTGLITVMAVMVVLLRSDVRRSATWLAAFGAIAGGWWTAASTPSIALATACGGLLSVAAIGHPPAGARLAGRRAWLLVPTARAIWPLAGWLLMAGWLAVRGNVAAAAVVGVGAASTIATAALVAMLLRDGGPEAAAASRALVAVGVAAAAALVVDVAGGRPLAQGVAAAVAGSMVFAGLVIGSPGGRLAGIWPSAGGGHRSPETGAGPIMVSALAGMVWCYFLAPQFAWAYAVLAVGWFVAAAVPPATASRGSAAATRLGRSAAGLPTVPGSLRRAVRITVVHLGLLAWPAIVACVLPAAEGSRAGGPLLALGWLAGIAVLLLLVVAVAAPRGRGEAARAVVLSAVAAAGFAAAAGVAKPPCFPGRISGGAQVPCWNGVEPLGATCQTSYPPRSARSFSGPVAFVERVGSGAR